MTLRKWRSNSPELLSTIPTDLRETSDLKIKDPLLASKALGIHWHVATDQCVYCWTDSAIALCWIKGSPSNLNIYVANRVAAIHKMTSPQQWKHVRSKHNPADLASRGTHFMVERSTMVVVIMSPIVRLYLHTMHVTLSHPGIATMMAILAEDHVIPHLRNHLKLISRHCVFCQRAYARTTHQRMGMLPLFRTEPAPPFSRTGIDFAGPFLVHRGNPRKPTRVKVYAALFVCFTTKAVHRELSSDLTAEAFLAALTRFCARIGTPLHLITDNGSNFLGAKKELEEVQKLLNHPVTTHRLSRLSTEKGLQWHLSPPRAPHFGGLWEAGVKAMKTLL